MMLYICNQSQHIWEQFQFSCEVAQCGKTLVSVFQEFFPGISGFSIWRVGWALGYHSMGFGHSPDIS